MRSSREVTLGSLIWPVLVVVIAKPMVLNALDCGRLATASVVTNEYIGVTFGGYTLTGLMGQDWKSCLASIRCKTPETEHRCMDALVVKTRRAKRYVKTGTAHQTSSGAPSKSGSPLIGRPPNILRVKQVSSCADTILEVTELGQVFCIIDPDGIT